MTTVGDPRHRGELIADPLALDPVLSWLVIEAPRLEYPALVEGFAWRLKAEGFPIDRLLISMQMLSPSLIATGIVWRPGLPLKFTRFDYADRDKGLYEKSPLKVAHESGEWVELDLAATPDDAFGVVPELKAAGLAHYIVIPIRFSRGSRNSLTIATHSPEGFSEREKARLRALLPALTNALELKSLHRTLPEILATYVGAGPAERIVAGRVHLGEVTSLRAAILVADLRGFTYLSTQLAPEATADMLNRYYDVVVPPIHERGGEVLKFIGDAVLAIFPVSSLGETGACLAALAAGETALSTPLTAVEVGGRDHPIRFGVAVHLGEAVYGNVGSGNRLDFTVVGRDVNVAARISTLCSRLGKPFLVSAEVAEAARPGGHDFRSEGAHEVRGLEDPLEVFEPTTCRANLERLAHQDAVSVGPVLM